MSHSDRFDEDKRAQWSTIKQWTLLRGYSRYREQRTVPPGTLVLVTHERPMDEEAHPLVSIAPATRRLLLENGSGIPPLILVVDLSGLAPDAKAMGNMLDAECSTLDTKKKAKKKNKKKKKSDGTLVDDASSQKGGGIVGKATARALEKLHLQDATLVASGKGCQLLLKLLITGGVRREEGSWARLVLL